MDVLLLKMFITCSWLQKNGEFILAYASYFIIYQILQGAKGL